jgi:thiol:disulfide interchange protein
VFETSLVDDFNILTNGITNANNMEIMALKEGSVKAYVVLYTNNNKKVLEKLDAAIDLDGTTTKTTTTTDTSTETTIGRNEIQALKILTKTKYIVKSDKLNSNEANTYVIKNKDSSDAINSVSASSKTDPIVSSDEEVENNSNVTSGGAAAISIIIVFVFIGLVFVFVSGHG